MWIRIFESLVNLDDVRSVEVLQEDGDATRELLIIYKDSTQEIFEFDSKEECDEAFHKAESAIAAYRID